MEFKSNTAYYAKHIPSGEEWYLLGIDMKGNRVCAAGYPPTIGKLSDCKDFEERDSLSEEEIKYRSKRFGDNWI